MTDSARLSFWWIRHGGLCLAACSFVLYVLLAQESGYGDGPGAILAINAGAAFNHALHCLYIPMVLGMRKLLGWTDLSLFQVGCVTSALGTSIGVGFLYAATRRLAPTAGEPMLVAALTVSCPAVVFFATTMEYHGPFFAFSSLAIYTLARLVENPSWISASAVGLATALAYLAHASAHLMLGMLLLCFFALAPRTRPNEGWRRQILLAGVILLTHVVSVVCAAFVLGNLLGAAVSSGSALGFLQQWADGHSDALMLWPETFWYEMIRPYLPLSIVWVWGLRDRAHRPLIWGLLLAGFAYFGLCMALIPGYNEHGAYQLPLVWPLAVIAVRALPRPLVLGMIGIGAVLAVVQIREHDNPEPARNYAAGLRQVAGGRPLCFVIGGDFVAYQACALHLRDVEIVDFSNFAGKSAEELRKILPILDRHLQAKLDQRMVVIFSRGAYEMLEMPIVQAVGGAALLKMHLDSQYRMQPVSAPGFAGWRVCPR